MTLTVFIPGLPASQGSKRVIGGRLIDTDRRLLRWRNQAALIIAAAAVQRYPRAHPISLFVDYRLPRPAKPRYIYPPRPDLDKLLRATCDALTQSGVIADDSQICLITTIKRFVGEDGEIGVMLALETLQRTEIG